MVIKEELLKQLQTVRDGVFCHATLFSRDLQAKRNALVQAAVFVFGGFSLWHIEADT